MKSFFSKKSGNKDESNKKVSLNPFEEKEKIAPTAEEIAATAATEKNKPTQAENDAAISKFYKDSGLYEGIDIGKMMKAATDGNEEDFGAIFAKGMENAAKVATIAAERIVNAKVKQASESAVTEATTTTRNDLALDQLHKDLPFTLDPALAPVAKSVLNGFLAQGHNVQESLKLSGEYFEATAKATGAHFDMVPKKEQGGSPRTRPFSQSRGDGDENNNQGGDPENDWVDTLTSGNQTFESVNEPPPAAKIDAGEGGENQSPTGE